MKINNIKVYQIDIPLKEKSYKWANDNIVNNFDSSIVVIETDNKIQGWEKFVILDHLTCLHTQKELGQESWRLGKI